MLTQTRSSDKAPKAQAAPSRTHASISPAPTLQGGIGFSTAQHFAGNLAVQQLFRGGAIQAKLSISQPNDPDELEADRVTDQVMRMAEPGPISSAPGVIHRKCAACDAGETTCPKCEEGEKVRRKEKPGHAPQIGPTAHAQTSALRDVGQPLPPSVRAFFEPRFAADFSQVRLHTDTAAAEAARAIQAKAFTAGQDVVFAAGEYVPDSAVGRKLLAHELTHTLQQKNRAGLQPGGLISHGEDPAEREADAIADTLFQHGEAVAVVQGQAVPAVQRDPQPGAGGQACAAAPEDFSRVSGAEALQGQIAELQPSSDPIASLEVLKKVWMTYGHEATGIYIRELLKLMWARGGQSSVDQFADRFIFRINIEYRSRTDPNDTDAVLARLIRDIVERDRKNVHTEAEQFLTCYEGQAREAAKGAVEESKERVVGELKHYYGSFGLVQTIFGTENSRDFEEDEASRKGLGIAAAGLSRRRKALISANAEYRAAVGNTTMLLEVREPIEQAHARASEDYEVFRSQVVAVFPILEAVSSPGIDPWDNQGVEPDDVQGKQLETLAQLAHGFTKDAGLLVFQQIQDRVKNIAKVKEELEPGGEINLWQLPQLVAATSDLTGATGDTFHGKLVADKYRKENEAKPESWTKRLLDILEIGLYVAALFTEGATLIPALMLTTYRAGSRAYEHLKQYQVQKALHGAGFGPTVLAVEEPSLYWLAADIALAFGEVGLSVVPAIKAFRALGPAARAARAAAASEEAILALENAAKQLTVAELGEAKATQFAAKVAADARAARAGAGRVAGMTAVEAEGFALAEAELTGAILAEVRTAGGQTIKVTARGRIFICSSPCQWLRERYAAQLAEAKLKDRMVKLEAKAASAAAQTDRAEAKRLADEVVAETQALHRDLAYAEYRQTGGTLGLEAFVNAERVRLIAESTAHAFPVLLTEARILEVLAHLFWRSPELRLLSPGAVERVVRAAHAVERVGNTAVPKGAMRLAVNWQDLGRGQLLEELASVRLRSLLHTQGGAEALGVGHVADDLIFIEGSRITDEAGLKVSDGIVAAWRRGELEILAIAEAKSAGGRRGASGLAVSGAELDRMSAMDIMQAVVEAAGGRSGRVLVQDRAMMKRLAAFLTPAQYDDVLRMSGGTLSKWTWRILRRNPAALRDLKEPLLQAIERLPARDRSAISALLSRGEGQVARDVERLMKEGTGRVTLKIDGETVTATIPSRPSFLGVAPSNVPLDKIGAQVTGQGYAFRALEMGSAGMTKEELDTVVGELVKALSDDLIKAANAAKP